MKFKTHWYLILPLTFGFVAALLLNYTALPNPVLYLRADLGTFLFLIGAGASCLGWITASFVQRLKFFEKEIEEKSVRDRRKFLSLLDHELKNPLTAIMAGLANLNDGTQQETLHSVEAQVQRLSRLVADLRKLSDLETRPIEMNGVNLPVLLEEVFVLAQSRAGEDRVLNLAIPKAPWPLPEIQGDRDLLFLAVHNVIDNAIKYTKPGDTIELRANEEGSQVRIEIADTGPGIPASETSQVWGELFRGEAARGIPGSGLGLALVQAIIRRHGGQTSLRSQLDKGTVITLTLPTHGVTEL
ncbi:MAG: HAMP domain-containing histidine kinase [Anaerolineales bacterium]|nr:HAMP domain-containing histidine kinase [Anaerolineales bacterium]